MSIASVSSSARRLAWWPALTQALRRSLRTHALFIAVILLHAAVALVLPPLLGLPVRYEPSYYGSTFLALTAIALVAFGITYGATVLLVVRPERPLRHIRSELTGKMLTLDRLCMALPFLLLFPLFTATFSFFKSAIPVINPFSWDPLFAEWDRLLHGGYEPWQLLQPLLGHPWITTLINGNYHLWLGVTYGVILWQMVDTRQPRLRMQYLLTFLLLWILIGNLAATLLSSAGPVYYGRVTGLVDPFAPLMEYLRAANAVSPVPALEVQNLLWHWYERGTVIPGAGISAMPSMHLAIVFSFVLLGFATSRLLGIIFGVFAAIVLIGSVHLGWHYAIDGYAAIIATWLIWLAVGRLLDLDAVARLLGLPEDRPETGASAAAG
ncbi:MAG: phosphatase PAP2 family protein, partial [Dongiaceae bacterium]